MNWPLFLEISAGMAVMCLLTWYLFKPGKPPQEQYLTPEQQIRLVALLRERLPSAQCSLCKHNSLTIGTLITAVREFNKGLLLLGAPVTPLVHLICDKCGNTMSFSAIKLGVVNPTNGDITL